MFQRAVPRLRQSLVGRINPSFFSTTEVISKRNYSGLQVETNDREEIFKDLDAKKLKFKKSKELKRMPEPTHLEFGKTMTDHMFQVDWHSERGWGDPRIEPFGNLSIHPAATCLHYAMEIFEGMKAYKDEAGNVRLFRPEMNIQRFANSAARLALPKFDKEQLLECLKQYVKSEAIWIPQERGYSLYLRPTLIGTQPFLGVGPSKDAKLFIIASPVGPYYKTGFAPVSLLADPQYVRAWPGGVGNTKCGGNYAPGIVPQVQAGEKGHSQMLWLYGPDHEITEVGTMNLFTYWINEEGEKELVTAPLEDGTILPGVTRDSIIKLAQAQGIKVSEKKKTMADVIKACKEKRLIEMFGSGTACIVSPIKSIEFQGQLIDIPLAMGNAGKLTTFMNDTLLDIQYGKIEHEWSLKL